MTIPLPVPSTTTWTDNPKVLGTLASFLYLVVFFLVCRCERKRQPNGSTNKGTSTPQPHIQQVVPTNKPSTTTNVSLHGSLVLIMGPMFAQKTSHGILLLRHHTFRKKGCLAVKHVMDQRYTQEASQIVTHDGMQFEPSVFRETLDPRSDETWKQMVDSYDVFLIEEGHFFRDLKSFCLYAIRHGKLVYVSCLNGTSEQTMFPSIVDVIPYANRIISRQSPCVQCQDLTPCTYATVPKTRQVRVGGKNLYEPRCLACMPVKDKKKEGSEERKHSEGDQEEDEDSDEDGIPID